MLSDSTRKLCIFNICDGLQDGLAHFSGPSRAALIYAETPNAPMRVYDPQNLLQGHEKPLRELYLDNQAWRLPPRGLDQTRRFRNILPEENLDLAGLISWGGRSESVFYQMWFTEHHPDMCAIGPTERWLEHAAWLLSNDLASENPLSTGTSGYVLRGYATHAVRDFIVDELNFTLGMDIHMRSYPILDAVLGISKTMEESAWPRGQLVFVEPDRLQAVDFLARFPVYERPNLANHKHVRKLLLAVERSSRQLVSDGRCIVGIAAGKMPTYRITADFRGADGFLSLNGTLICSFFDGGFHSTTRRAKLVHLEEILLETRIDPLTEKHIMFQVISRIVHHVEDQKHGCTLVIDLNKTPLELSGQKLEKPVDLKEAPFLDMAKALTKADGALHIGADIHLHGFACILDGRAIPGENRARGARFNSALRFSAEHEHVVVVVVSSDRPVSVIQGGVELNAQCILKPLLSCDPAPVPLENWLAGADA